MYVTIRRRTNDLSCQSRNCFIFNVFETSTSHEYSAISQVTSVQMTQTNSEITGLSYKIICASLF